MVVTQQLVQCVSVFEEKPAQTKMDVIFKVARRCLAHIKSLPFNRSLRKLRAPPRILKLLPQRLTIESRTCGKKSYLWFKVLLVVKSRSFGQKP